MISWPSIPSTGRCGPARMSEMLILYTIENGRSQIQLCPDQQTVWISPAEIAELFDNNR